MVSLNFKVTEECYAAVTRSQADQTKQARPVHLQVADLVSKDSIVAIAAEEDDSYNYYLCERLITYIVITSSSTIIITIVLNLQPQSTATGYLITPSHVLNTF